MLLWAVEPAAVFPLLHLKMKILDDGASFLPLPIFIDTNVINVILSMKGKKGKCYVSNYRTGIRRGEKKDERRRKRYVNKNFSFFSFNLNMIHTGGDMCINF